MSFADHRVLLLLPLLLVAADRVGVTDFQQSDSLGLDARLPFCEAAKGYDVSAEVLAGVFLFENQINRGIKDTVEDAAFRVLLSNTDEDWWTKWADRTMKM